MRTTKKRVVRKIAGPAIKIVEAAGNYILDADKRLGPDAAIRGIEQAYLILSERASGATKRAYLKRAVLLGMLLVELESK